MNLFLPVSQIIVAVILMVVILLQQRGTALGSAFGESSSFYSTRRGFQEKLYRATIILGALFIILALLNLLF